MKCVREIERLALCSANSQIVLRRSKAECDREELHTPFFKKEKNLFKAASHSALFCFSSA